MRKELLAGVLLLLAAALPADWKKDAAVRIANEKEYPRLVESLQQAFADLPRAEKAAVCVLIGYCQSRMNVPHAELSWMKKYLEEFRAAAVDLRFLPLASRQKVLKFKSSWQEDFPVFWELALDPEDAEIAFFDPPARLKLRLQVSLPCEFQLLAPDGAPLAGGSLGKEIETIKIPLAPDFFKFTRHPFRLLLTLRRAPEKTVEKYFSIELHYLFPEDVAFDPVSGEVKLKGREFQPESRSETRVLSQHTHFDKELFKKTVLKDLLIGTAFFVVDATLLQSTIDNSTTSLYAKSALYGTRRAFQLAGVGFSLSALAKLPRLFKREKVVEERTIDLPEARAANEALKRDLELARKKMRARLDVQAI